MEFFKRTSAKKAVVIMELYKSNGLLKCSTARIMIYKLISLNVWEKNSSDCHDVPDMVR